jgi:hypothetical protein
VEEQSNIFQVQQRTLTYASRLSFSYVPLHGDDRLGKFNLFPLTDVLIITCHLSATLQSWNEAYVGEAHLILYDDVAQQCQRPGQAYARYRAIVQSSGMGKSRTVDELAKEHLVIPINLRREGTGMCRRNVKRAGFIVVRRRFSSRGRPSMRVSHTGSI